jgi:hypothetical protein
MCTSHSALTKWASNGASGAGLRLTGGRGFCPDEGSVFLSVENLIQFRFYLRMLRFLRGTPRGYTK